ncbi:MAG: sigma 54-interacting transcriptional regulator [Polyangiaceae bacterium]|nr:sigma 54-interacting transcriptional regulator [Polyangiaceae bacterium]
MRGSGDDVTTQMDLASQIGATDAQDQRAYLVVRTDTVADVRVLDEGGAFVVGRTKDADVVVDDARVSRRNTEIALRGRRLIVRDLGSRNGTRVNATVLKNEERAAVRGDEIVIGPAKITVAATPSAPSAPAPTAVSAAARAFVAEDPKMKEIFALVERLAHVPTPVLIRGETGVGKEILADRLHAAGPRARGTLLRVNCAAVVESLLESELFGHERGAFTGATERKRGLVEAASGGTLFLDEIGDLPPAMQAKLLRVLETQRVQRVGGREEVQVDVRYVAATHQDLEAMVERGTFRRDLYYRLAGFIVDVPALRLRRADILPLARRFASAFASKIGLAGAPQLSTEAESYLLDYLWPGNVRELKNAMEHAVVLANGAAIVIEHLPKAVASPPTPESGSMAQEVDSAERRAVDQALEAAGGNRARAAELLGVSKRTLQYRLAKWGIKS